MTVSTRSVLVNVGEVATGISNIRSEKAFAVVVDHVRRVVGAPDFGLPGDLVDVLTELGPVGKQET